MYNLGIAKDVIRVTEAEAAGSFGSLLERVRAGAEVVIEHNSLPVAVVKPVEGPVRKLSESLRLAKERGSKATLDEGFAADLESAINSHREPLTPPAWE